MSKNPSVFLELSNELSKQGNWVDLTQFKSHEDFFAWLTDRVGEQSWWFSDNVGFPDAFFAERGLDERLWEWLALSEQDKDIWRAALTAFGNEVSCRDAQELFYGHYDSQADFASQYAEEAGLEIPSWLVVEWQATWDCNLRHDFVSVYYNGAYYIFHNL